MTELSASAPVRATRDMIGPFLPGFARDVHLFSDIDVSTIRTWSNMRAYLRSSSTSTLSAVASCTSASTGAPGSVGSFS